MRPPVVSCLVAWGGCHSENKIGSEWRGRDGGFALKIAIQGELGSNSHMATLAMLGNESGVEIVAVQRLGARCWRSVVAGEVDGAVLPIENSLHGSVAEHYDLLLELPVRIEGESLLRIRHNLIAMPGVKLDEVRRVMSHPVALSQCRKFLAAHPEFEVVPFYDTAGSVKHLMAEGLRDVAGIAPELAAERVWRGGSGSRYRGPCGELHAVSPDPARRMRSDGRSGARTR